MDKEIISEVHPEASKQHDPPKPTKIPKPVFGAWQINEKNKLHASMHHHHYRESSSAPTSPRRYLPYSPSPLSSPVKSGESTPIAAVAQTMTQSSNFDSTKSMPTMPSRIPVAKTRYNVPPGPMGSTSMTDSVMSSEFSSTIDLDSTPSHSCSQHDNESSGTTAPDHRSIPPSNRTCDSPSMLYPLEVKSSVEQALQQNNSCSNTALPSFSTITVPSIGSDNDEISRCSDVSLSSRNSSQLLDYPASKSKLSAAEDSAIFDQSKPDYSSEKILGLIKELKEARASIEFLEDENRLLKEKARNDDTIYQQQIDRLKFDSLKAKQAAENREKKQQEVFQRQVMEMSQQNEELTKKLSQQIEISSSLEAETETQISSMRTDLIASQSRAKQLEEKLITLKSEKHKLEDSFAQEKKLSSELQTSLDSVSYDLSSKLKNIEVLHEQNENLKRIIHKNEEDNRRLNENAKSHSKEKVSSSEKLQSLTAEKESLIEELELTKKELLEARAQHKNSEMKLREVGQKLSAIECEAKEKGATIYSGVRKIEIANKENEEFRRRIQKMEERLVIKDRELTSLVLEKEGMEEKVIQLEDQLRNEQSRLQEIVELTKEMGQIKAKNKHLHEQLLEKEKAWKDSERHLAKIKYSLESEKEQKNTITLKLAGTEEELASLKNRYEKLESHGQQFIQETEAKIAALKEKEDDLQQQLKIKTDALRLKEEKSYSLAISLSQAETENEKAKAKTVELETQVALSMADVENHKKLCEKFQSKLQLIQDSKHQEIAELNAQLNSKRFEITKLNSKLESIHVETNKLKIALQQSNEALEHEKTLLSSVQSDLAVAENNGSELTSHLTHLEEHIKSLNTQNAILKSKLEENEIKNNHQSDQISTLNQSLKDTWKKLEERKCEIESLKESHLEEVQHLCQAKDTIEANLELVTELSKQSQEKLEIMQQSNEQTSLELRKEQDARNSLQLSLETETESRNELAKKYTLLETRYNDACSQIQSLKMKIVAAEKEIEYTKDQLTDSQSHSAAVEKDVKLMKAKFVKTGEEMEEKMAQLVSQYEKEITNFKISYKDLKDMADKLSEEIAHRKNETALLKSKLEKGSNLNQQLKKKMAEQKANEMVQVKRISDLEIQLANEMESKMAIKRDLTLQLSKEHDLQLKLDELHNKLCVSVANQESVEVQLHEERIKVATLQDQVKSTEGELKKKRNALTKEKEMRTNLKLSSEAELSQLKKKYQSEIKIFKDKCKDLNAELNLLKASCVSKATAIDKLQALSDDLERGNRMLQTQLDKVKKEWEEKSDMLSASQARNQGLEIQLARLQAEVSSLTKSQLDFEEYKKKIELSSREELQRVLQEVTQHMEEQHTAHHYLEKLRKENESIALKEKDRQIDQLKNHLKKKKQELKKDRLHIETLEIESRFLKSLQKDNSKSRHEIEERLGKISDALSIATASNSFSSGTVSAPHPSSTPIKNKSFQ